MKRKKCLLLLVLSIVPVLIGCDSLKPGDTVYVKAPEGYVHVSADSGFLREAWVEVEKTTGQDLGLDKVYKVDNGTRCTVMLTNSRELRRKGLILAEKKGHIHVMINTGPHKGRTAYLPKKYASKSP